MNKKIVFAVGVFPSISETFVINQIITAIDLGYKVKILARKKNSIEDSSQSKIIQQYSLLDKTVELKNIIGGRGIKRLWGLLITLKNGISFEYLKTFNYFKYGKYGLAGNYYFYLVQHADIMDADLFHIQFGNNIHPLCTLKKNGLLRGKIVTTFHGFDAHYTQESYCFFCDYYKPLFEHASLITCNSSYLKKKLVKLGCAKEKIQILPMPVDTDYFRPRINPKSNAILQIISVGRLIQLKGHEWGIKAVSLLIDKGYNVNYHILGEGKERENLENLIEISGLGNYIFLDGMKTQEEIKSYMQQADIFLMTSTFDADNRREAQGLVTGEAQACELPVIAFRSGGVPDTLIDKQTGFLCQENNYKEMAEKIKILLDNHSLRREMGMEARRFILNSFSQKKAKDDWSNIYSNLV